MKFNWTKLLISLGLKKDKYLIINPKWFTARRAEIRLSYLLGYLHDDESDVEQRRRWNHVENSGNSYGSKGYYKSKGSGLFIDIWTAYDNSTGECWVEDFKTEEGCIRWLNGQEKSEMPDSY